MNTQDQEQAARDDIIARPEVTAEAKKQESAQPVKQLNITSVKDQSPEPDDLEKSAGKVMAKAIEDLKGEFGMQPDNDFSQLMSEALGGMFSALRMISGAPWMRFAVAGGAIAFAFLPPFIRFMAAKKDQEEQKA